MKLIALEKIIIDGGTQFRSTINESKVSEYAEMLTDSKEWPFDSACDVFFDGSEYFLVDGFHRYLGAKQVKLASISCKVHDGTLRDAIKFALSANARHGLHRSNEDKRKAVAYALQDCEWSLFSSRAIAEICGVSPAFIDSNRKSVANGRQLKTEMRTGKDGKQYQSTKPKSDQKPEPVVEVEYTDVDDEPEPDEIPESLKPIEWFKDQLKLVNELKRNLNSVKELPGTELIFGRQRTLLREIEHVKGGFVAACPHAICPRCNGETCAQCGNMGWVNKQRFDELGAN